MDKKIKPIESDEQAALDPFEIEFLPEFIDGKKPRGAFINEHGVVIGDHMYESPNSPLNQWTTDTDPAIMAGDEWVHPYKDIGLQTAENRDYFEKGIEPKAGTFMHQDKDVAYDASTADRDEENQDTADKFEKADDDEAD